jgi:uncharacterized RDD family membrane protein YckC
VANLGRRDHPSVREDSRVSQHGYPYQPPPGQGQPYGQPAGAPHGGPYQAPPPSGYGVPPQAGYGYPAAQPGYPAYPGQQLGYPAQPGWPQAEVGPNGEPLAEQFSRLGARVIDGLILGGITMIIFVPLFVVIVVATTSEIEVAPDGTVTGGGPSFALMLLVYLGMFVFIIAAQFLYEVQFAKRTGQTIGKRMLKIRVVPTAPHQPITAGHLAKRWLVTGPGGMIPGLGLINALWCLWDKPYRQCLHDKFADTVVVKVPG